MKKRILKIINVVMLLVGLVIIYFVGSHIGWALIWDKIKGVEVYQIGLILIFPLFFYLFHVLGWFLLLDEKNNFKFKHIFSAHVASVAVSEIVPLGQAGGEPYRAYFVRKFYGKEKSPNIFASVILYNTIHTIATGMLITLGFFMLLTLISVKTYKIFLFLGGITVGLIAVYFFIKAQKKGILETLFRFLGRYKLFKKFTERKLEKAALVDERLRNFYNQNKLKFMLSLGLIFIAKMLGALEFYMILNFIGYPVDFFTLFIVFAGNAFVQLLLFFFPAQIGASEGSIVYLFKALHLDPLMGITMAFFKRIRVILWTIIGLIVAWIWGPRPGR
jgi:uncharacterized protein (TIRG00374 family)